MDKYGTVTAIILMEDDIATTISTMMMMTMMMMIYISKKNIGCTSIALHSLCGSKLSVVVCKCFHIVINST